MIPERLASDFIGISRDFLATPGVLKLLVYQSLLPRLCTACSLPFESLSRGKDAPAAGWRHWGAALQQDCGIDPARLRIRNAAGCPACTQAALADTRGQLSGYLGRTVVAEMFAPAQDEALLDCIRRRDNPGLMRHLAAMPRASVEDPDMGGKPVHLCAAYKAAQGELDARVLARHFGLGGNAVPRATAAAERGEA